MTYAGNPKDYLPSIGPSHRPKQKDPLRRILTTGLVVLILEYMHAVEKAVPQMGLAFKRLYRDYQTNTVWIVDTDRTSKAWGRFKPVAHLAAAWLRVLIDTKRLANNRKALLMLQKNLPAFLGYAAHYERFLSSDKITGQTVREHIPLRPNQITYRSILKSAELWTLGSMAPGGDMAAIISLPVEGLKKKTRPLA